MTDNRKPIRHGEALLVPVAKLPEGKTQKTDKLIVAHSETGHHHVVEARGFGSTDTLEKEGIEFLTVDDQLFLLAVESGQLVHTKESEKHRTVPVEAGAYEVRLKKEYDPNALIRRQVAD